MSIFLRVQERRDVVDFVREVEKHPCLYNRNIREYNDKIKQGQAWAEIAKQMGTSAVDCRDKWRKIRISYIRSLKLQRSDKPPGRPYYLAADLNFLLPFVKDGEHKNPFASEKKDFENVESANNEDTESSVDSFHDNDVNFINVGESIPKFEVTDSLSEATPAIRRRTEVLLDNASSARQMFLSSLMPEIESFSEQEMRVFRREVISLIDHIITTRDKNGMK